MKIIYFAKCHVSNLEKRKLQSEDNGFRKWKFCVKLNLMARASLPGFLMLAILGICVYNGFCNGRNQGAAIWLQYQGRYGSV